MVSWNVFKYAFTDSWSLGNGTGEIPLCACQVLVCILAFSYGGRFFQHSRGASNTGVDTENIYVIKH